MPHLCLLGATGYCKDLQERSLAEGFELDSCLSQMFAAQEAKRLLNLGSLFCSLSSYQAPAHWAVLSPSSGTSTASSGTSLPAPVVPQPCPEGSVAGKILWINSEKAFSGEGWHLRVSTRSKELPWSTLREFHTSANSAVSFPGLPEHIGVGGVTEASLQFGQVSNGPSYSRAVVIFSLKTFLARREHYSPPQWPEIFQRLPQCHRVAFEPKAQSGGKMNIE